MGSSHPILNPQCLAGMYLYYGWQCIFCPKHLNLRPYRHPRFRLQDRAPILIVTETFDIPLPPTGKCFVTATAHRWFLAKTYQNPPEGHTLKNASAHGGVKIHVLSLRSLGSGERPVDLLPPPGLPRWHGPRGRSLAPRSPGPGGWPLSTPRPEEKVTATAKGVYS